ncbi:MAG: hypothetical protein K5888_12330 [Lachnospiraceae bacterium]|nr:hypothetical protein [Lachnospiraceae bacterium]
MKEQKIARIIILTSFIVFICLSRIVWFFTADLFDSENHEKRQLAERPSFSLESYGTFSEDYTAYFNDNMQFRNALIALHTLVDHYVMGSEDSGFVAIGSDDMLFYTKKEDGDPIANYKGTDLYPEEELDAFVENCRSLDETMKAEGREFVIMLIPNKERIFSEKMPKKFGAPAEKYRIKQVYEALCEKTDIRVIYAYDELMKAKEELDVDIWYKTDTHWNNVGGYVGAKILLDELGVPFPDITDERLRIYDTEEISGDLAMMLNQGNSGKYVDKVYGVEGYDDHGLETVNYDWGGAIIYHAENADPRRIYVIRDSFCTAMADYIGSQFDDTCLRHYNTYTGEDLESWNPDIVVYEVVERGLDELMTFSFDTGS